LGQDKVDWRRFRDGRRTGEGQKVEKFVRNPFDPIPKPASANAPKDIKHKRNKKSEDGENSRGLLCWAQQFILIMNFLYVIAGSSILNWSRNLRIK
jgi:hypothetical protein